MLYFLALTFCVFCSCSYNSLITEVGTKDYDPCYKIIRIESLGGSFQEVTCECSTGTRPVASMSLQSNVVIDITKFSTDYIPSLSTKNFVLRIRPIRSEARRKNRGNDFFKYPTSIFNFEG